MRSIMTNHRDDTAMPEIAPSGQTGCDFVHLPQVARFFCKCAGKAVFNAEQNADPLHAAVLHLEIRSHKCLAQFSPVAGIRMNAA